MELPITVSGQFRSNSIDSKALQFLKVLERAESFEPGANLTVCKLVQFVKTPTPWDETPRSSSIAAGIYAEVNLLAP